MRSRSFFSERLKLIVDILDGSITTDEMLAVRLEANERGWIRPGVRTLTIVRGEHVALTPEGLQSLARQLDERVPELARAPTAVVASTPVSTAYVMLYSMDNPQQTVRVFSTVPAAMKWLGLPLSDALQDIPELALYARA